MKATGSFAELLDEIAEQRRTAAREEARLAGQLLTFVDARRASDAKIQAADEVAGREPRFKPGEFAADELSLATTLSVYDVQCLVARTRRIQHRLPSVWDAWRAGDIDGEKVRLIDKCLRRLCGDEAVFRLELEVIDAAIAKTAKQLTSWLDRFVARVEPDQHREREIAQLKNRYVSNRPGLDGTRFLTAMGSTYDVQAADQQLNELAYGFGARDPRTMDQRRSDALFDLLLGRITGQDTGTVSTTIGVVVPVTSLVGDSDTPGQLIDRSGTVPASLIRDLAAQPGTLFYRLLTDPVGGLLDVTEMGRFASKKLGWALDFRAGSCVFPTCGVAATSCDHDHHVPAPEGATAGWNLDPECRRQHRAKTHAGFKTSRAGPTVSVTTPTGHTYTRTDDPLPVEDWATDPIDEHDIDEVNRRNVA